MKNSDYYIDNINDLLDKYKKYIMIYNECGSYLIALYEKERVPHKFIGYITPPMTRYGINGCLQAIESLLSNN